LAEELDATKKAKATLAGELEKATNAGLVDELKAWKAEKAALAHDMEAAKAEKAGFAHEVEAVKAEKAGLAHDLETAKAEKAGLAHELRAATADKIKFADELQAAKQKMAVMADELKATNAEKIRLSKVVEDLQNTKEKPATPAVASNGSWISEPVIGEEAGKEQSLDHCFLLDTLLPTPHGDQIVYQPAVKLASGLA
jgi:hypothetical protein